MCEIDTCDHGSMDGADPEAIIEISDFSNLSDAIWRLIPKYGVLGVTGWLSKTSSPDLRDEK